MIFLHRINHIKSLLKRNEPSNQKYLDVNSDILDNKYIMQSQIDRQSSGQTKITDKQATKLSNLSNIAVKMTCTLKIC